MHVTFIIAIKAAAELSLFEETYVTINSPL